MPRREYKGNVAATTINGAITAGSTEIQITDATSWPTGSPGPFVVIVDRGLAAEEKILITSRTGTTLFVGTRGFDSTTAASHSSGATIEHGLSATDIDEANDHVFDTTNDDHTQYLTTGRHDVEARHAFGAGLGTPSAPVDVNGETNTASAGSGDDPAREDHVHAWDDLAWVAWTPTLTNLTLGNGTSVATFMRIGRTIHYRWKFTLGTTSAVGTSPRFTLPVAPHADVSGQDIALGLSMCADQGIDSFPAIVCWISGSTVEIKLVSDGTGSNLALVTATVPHTWGSTDFIWATGTYEAAAGS